MENVKIVQQFAESQGRTNIAVQYEIGDEIYCTVLSVSNTWIFEYNLHEYELWDFVTDQLNNLVCRYA